MAQAIKPQYHTHNHNNCPASVHNTDPWVDDLLQLIRTNFAKNIPQSGACFGHQAIAMALDGNVESNDGGWVFGLTECKITTKAEWMLNLPNKLLQYGAHIEQVTKLPRGAEVVSSSDKCAVTGFRIANAVYTTQNHPEMTPSFVAALVDEYTPKLPAGVGELAKQSHERRADTLPYAESIARFFEATSPN